MKQGTMMQGSARGPPTPWLRLKCLPPSLFKDKNEAIKQAFKVWGCSRVEPVLNPISRTYTRQAIVQLRSAQVVRCLFQEGTGCMRLHVQILLTKGKRPRLFAWSEIHTISRTRQAIVQLRCAQMVRFLIDSQHMRVNPARWGFPGTEMMPGCSEANLAPAPAKPLCSYAVPEW